MKESNNFKEVVMYEYEDFFVEIRVTHKEYEAWLQHKNYGVMSLMFGSPKEQTYGHITYGQFKQMVSNNLVEYIKSYREEYMDD